MSLYWKCLASRLSFTQSRRMKRIGWLSSYLMGQSASNRCHLVMPGQDWIYRQHFNVNLSSLVSARCNKCCYSVLHWMYWCVNHAEVSSVLSTCWRLLLQSAKLFIRALHYCCCFTVQFRCLFAVCYLLLPLNRTRLTHQQACDVTSWRHHARQPVGKPLP